MSFGSKIDAVKNLLEPFTNHKVVKLSSLRDYFSEPNEADRVLKETGDVVVYEYYERIFGEGGGHINFGLTVMYPGKIGREYFLTRGHFHEKDAAEIYVGLKGVGYILMQTRDGKVEARVIEPDTVVYVPPGYGHRTINTGTEPLVFFFAYPSDAGHDYEAVKEKGFAKLVVEENGKPKLIDNPKYLMSPMV